MRRVGMERNLPALPGARLEAGRLEHEGKEARGDLLSRGNHGVIFALVIEGRLARRIATVLLQALLEAPGLLDESDELVGVPGHGRDHDGASVAGIDLALDVRGDVPDAVDVGNRRPAEFEHQQGHLGPSTQEKGRPLAKGRPENRVFHTDCGACPQWFWVAHQRPEPGLNSPSPLLGRGLFAAILRETLLAALRAGRMAERVRESCGSWSLFPLTRA